MKIVFLYSPFCTPATPPYSITNLAGILRKNTKHEIKCIDLNEKFHNLKFSEMKNNFKKINNDIKFYKNFNSLTMKCYSENNKKILDSKNPEFSNEIINLILKEKPDFVAFSLVYSSQVFYTYFLIQELKKQNIKIIVGGPAVSEKIKKVSDYFFESEKELLEFFEVKKINYDYYLDFSDYDLDNYFVKENVLPLKTSSTCYYKKCSFCSHYSNRKYQEYDLSFLEKTILKNKSKYFFIIDDMIHSKRLLEISKIFKKHNKEWACQLKPTKDFNLNLMKKLKSNNLKFVMWGVESGNNGILNKMNKSTNVEDISEVLMNSKKAEIINVVYVMFGFPSETKENFLQTIDFLKKNKNNIDLVSSTVFGLQKNTYVYNNPEKYNLKILKEKRTLLDCKVTYEIKEGLTSEEASKLRRKYIFEINKINKFPDWMNFFREQMFFVS